MREFYSGGISVNGSVVDLDRFLRLSVSINGLDFPALGVIRTFFVNLYHGVRLSQVGSLEDLWKASDWLLGAR
jgi:hypothetical protein